MKERTMKLLKLSSLSLVLMALPLFAADSAFVGTWKLNVDRSKFEPGPAMLFATVLIESSGKGLKTTASNADGKGVASDLMFDSPLDGTSSPVSGSPVMDMISLQRMDDHTIAATATKEGKLVYADRRVVSADGQTLTITRDGTTPDGKKYRSTIILERLP
jgi:hypothetical protein